MGDRFGHFTTLDAAECRELLRTHTIGRIGWESSRGPQILPITYAVRGDQALFRTAPGGVLAELGSGVRVALEVDELDPETRTGWSVLARGTTSAPADPAAVLRAWEGDAPRPWVSDDRTLLVLVDLAEVSGRVLAADD